MQYWWPCEINSNAAELILVVQLAALQIAELLLVKVSARGRSAISLVSRKLLVVNRHFI